MTSNDNFFAYSEYKSTEVEWVESIPRHWESRPLFSTVKRQQIKNTGNKESKVLSLSYGNIVRRNVETNFGLLPESFETYQIVKPGNIILRLTDLQNDKRSLRVGLVKEDGIITSAYICLQPLPGINNEYIYLLLHSYDIMKVFYSLGSGVRQSLTYDELKRLSLIVPPMEEQKAIVDFVNQRILRVDNLIEKKQRLIELLKEKRQALITNAVTKGLDPSVPMKDSGIPWLGEVPEHWEIQKGKHFLSLFGGYAPEEMEVTESLNGISYYKVDDLNSNSNELYIEVSKLKVLKKTAKTIPTGTIIIPKRGAAIATNKVRITKRDCYVDSNIMGLKPRNNHVKFIAYYFIARGLIDIADVSTIPQINNKHIKELFFPLPSYREQNQIIDYLENQTSKFQLLTKKLQTQITKLREYRQALITAAVTGKIDVREKVSSRTY